MPLASHRRPLPPALPTFPLADGPPPRSPITTHVLDTCMGRPAPDVAVTLARAAPGSGATAWEVVARGRTNADGRIGDLLTPGEPKQR